MEKKRVGAGVGVMILNKDGKVLLGKRHDDPQKADSALHGEGTWTMPGGSLEVGESFEEWSQRTGHSSRFNPSGYYNGTDVKISNYKVNHYEPPSYD